MSRNNFQFHLPKLKHCNRLQKPDLSHNNLIRVLPSSLFALPDISYLSLTSNAFTGSLPLNLTCGANLNVVDLSLNFLIGSLPPFLASLIKWKKNVKFYKNSLDTRLEDQHSYLFCKNVATATSVSSRRPKQSSRAFKVAMILGIVGGLIALLAVLGLVLLLVLRVVENKRRNQPPIGNYL